MQSSDPYRSTNPWSLARYLKNSCKFCPSCRTACAFDISVDREEELIRMYADCPSCGRNELVPSVGEDGDLLIESSGKIYEPDAECHGISAGTEGHGPEGSSPEMLGRFSAMALRYAATRRPAKAVELGRSVASEYRANIGKEGWENAADRSLAQCSATATVLIDSGRNKDALELYNEYLPLTEGNDSGTAFAFILARSFSVFAEGDAKEPTAAVRGTIAALDRMRSENRIPADDPFIRSRAYEALGVLLSAKNDKTGAMKAMKKALEDSREVLARSTTDEGLRWMNRCAREYAFASFQAEMKKRSMEALKDSIKICAANREKFPHAYAESLLERGMFIADSGADIPPYLRKDMEDAISILSKPDAYGRYDPLLPIAYFYHSMTGADKEKLDGGDLEKAYTIIRDGVNSGDVPESVLSSVVDAYATYLDENDEEKAGQIRRELAEMGIWVHPPAKKKQTDAPPVA